MIKKSSWVSITPLFLSCLFSGSMRWVNIRLASNLIWGLFDYYYSLGRTMHLVWGVRRSELHKKLWDPLLQPMRSWWFILSLIHPALINLIPRKGTLLPSQPSLLPLPSRKRLEQIPLDVLPSKNSAKVSKESSPRSHPWRHDGHGAVSSLNDFIYIVVHCHADPSLCSPSLNLSIGSVKSEGSSRRVVSGGSQVPEVSRPRMPSISTLDTSAEHTTSNISALERSIRRRGMILEPQPELSDRIQKRRGGVLNAQAVQQSLKDTFGLEPEPDSGNSSESGGT